jgi:hypothetical protein
MQTRKIIGTASVGSRRRLPTNNSNDPISMRGHSRSLGSAGKFADDTLAAVPEAAVATVTVTAVAVLPVTLTEPGTVHTGAGVAAGVMAQARFTVPLKDPAGVRFKLKVAVCPAEMVWLDPPEPALKVKSGTAVPVPDRATICEPVPALSATTRLAVAAPASVGANFTLIVQLVDG